MRAELHHEDITETAIVGSPPPKKFYQSVGEPSDLGYVVHHFELVGIQDGAAHYRFFRTSVV